MKQANPPAAPISSPAMPPPLTPQDWHTALDLLDQALELPVAQRADWLAQMAPAHAHLKPTLQQLLDDRRAIETADFLQALPPLDAPTAGAARAAGQQVGPWLLLRELGQGGMASVWLARRADGAHQREVALKLPHRVHATRTLVQRFERERSILSTLDHPHIAPVLDAGTDGDQPWLAMAFVDGRSITDLAQTAGLSVRDRLRLFLPVLHAVQHAHARLVIHRDIKPSNLLVTADGRVMLLDFGVAKLLQGDGLADESALTQLDGRAMTPQYASPEQVAGRPLGVATDIYSLGLLLYELLTGRLPYRLPRNTAAALEEAILTAERLPPSQAVESPALRRALQGDIDTIVLKALATAPEQRYASVQALAEDIDRHLQALPIHARPATWHYRAGRLLRRHMLAASAAAAVAVALVTGAGVAAWQASIARDEARRSLAVQAFLSKVLAYNDPQQAQGRERSARELLLLTAAQIDTDFKGQPDVQARLHQTVGSILLEMGAFKPAAEHLQAAQALREAADARADADTVETLFRLGQAQRDLRQFDAAKASLARALKVGDALAGSPHRWTGQVLASQAWLAMQTGQGDKAMPLAEEALRQQRGFSGEHSVDFLRVAHDVSALQIARGRLDEAQVLIELIDREAETLPEYPVIDRLGARAQLASVRFARAEFEAARALLADLVPRYDRHVGAPYDRTAVVRSTYARTLAELGEYAQAVQVQQANVEHVRPRAAAEPEAVNLVRLQLVRLLTQAGRASEAEPLARELLAFFEARYVEPTRYREAARAYLADAQLAQGRREEGLRTLQMSIDQAARLGAADNPLERANKQLSWAVAARGLSGVKGLEVAQQSCARQLSALGAANPRSRRCRAIEAWLAALVADPAQQASTLAQFVQAREQALASLPARHLLRAELLAAEAEILRRPGPAQNSAAAGQRLAQAQGLYRQGLGQDLPQPLLSLH
jgi:hypothetical protein